MTSTKYKEHTSRADAFQRATLTETISILQRTDAALARRIRSQLERLPIPKPERHTDGVENDVFKIDLFYGEVDAVIDALMIAEIDALGPNYTATNEASRFGNLLDVWNRYRFLLDENRVD